MDVFEMRVPEYAGKACAVRIPNSYAVEKTEYIKDRKQEIKKIDAEIESLKTKISTIADKEGYFYKEVAKRLEKCHEIKQNCEYSIALAKAQMNINKR